uniref:Uncharacterized protein n=1 Tax=Lactuca sativa TaxID=4236 RepID=A0A9R1UNG2_LACSA|nr:hypothetical protein LSAT_V11C800449110 [Lactuca sativa]
MFFIVWIYPFWILEKPPDFLLQVLIRRFKFENLQSPHISSSSHLRLSCQVHIHRPFLPLFSAIDLVSYSKIVNTAITHASALIFTQLITRRNLLTSIGETLGTKIGIPVVYIYCSLDPLDSICIDNFISDTYPGGGVRVPGSYCGIFGVLPMSWNL